MKKQKDSFLAEIKAGNNMEENLGKFSNRLMEIYHKYAMIDFTMNYFTYYEVIKYKENPEIDKISHLTKEVNDIICETMIHKFDSNVTEKSIEKLLQIREEIIYKMNSLTAYTDSFQIYEYVLNRLELNYADKVLDMDDIAVTNEILQYIFSTKDNVVINDKIKEVIGQLPIRMAKSKYFELLSNSLTVYKGSEKSSVDTYLYMLRTSAMLYKTDSRKEEFKDLADYMEELSRVDYKNLSKEYYLKLVKGVKERAEFIKNLVDAYVLLITLINNLCVIIISSPYIISQEDETEHSCKEIIKEINHNFVNEDLPDINEEITQKLTDTEGKQEELSFDFMQYESQLYDIQLNKGELIESLMLGKIYNNLSVCQKLVSSSIFIELEQSQNQGIADEIYIAKVTKDLLEEFKKLFEKSDIFVRRGIMANTINKMPVFFQNTNEVSDYIYNALNQCLDKGEKASCVAIIRQLME